MIHFVSNLGYMEKVWYIEPSAEGARGVQCESHSWFSMTEASFDTDQVWNALVAKMLDDIAPVDSNTDH